MREDLFHGWSYKIDVIRYYDCGILFVLNITWILMNTENILCLITLLIVQKSTLPRTSKEDKELKLI